MPNQTTTAFPRATSTWSPVNRVKEYCQYLFIVLFSFSWHTSLSQQFYIKKYTVNDGLPASYIIRIYQDSYGFMWIATFNGLSRFDGKQFVNYGYESGLPNIIIDAIYEDKQHRLWLGTRGGMAQMKGNRCVTYPVNDGQVINYISAFHEMKNGELWVFTNKGVYKFANDHWEKIKLYPGFEDHGCKNLIETDTGMLIQYPHHLVLRRHDGSFRLINQISYDDAPGAFFNDLFRDRNNLYLNTTDNFFEINGKDSFKLFDNELHGKYILHTYKDSKGRFWIYTLDDQLMISMPGDKQNFIYKEPMKLVSSFCEDKEGNMWVARLDGLLKMKAVNYENYEKKISTGIRGNCSLIKIPGNRLLVSGAYNKLFAIPVDSKYNTAKCISLKQTRQHSEIIDAWCNDEHGRVWLIFRNEGDLFLMEDNQIKFFPGLIKNNIHQLTAVAYNVQNHKLYVGADTLQVGNEKEMHNFRPSNAKGYIIFPTSLHCFSNGRILVGTRNSGFFIIDDKDNIDSVPKETILPYYTPGGVKIFDDPSGKFWIASPYGLARYKWNEKLMPVMDLQITTKQGLPNNGTRAVAFDKFNRIWAATLSGVVVIEIDSLKNNSVVVNRVSEEEGVTTELWNEAQLSADAKGNIWVGLYNQLIKFDPLKIEFEKTIPSIAIENIQLNFKETKWESWTDSLQGMMEIPYQPVLPHDKNNLGIFFKGISFSNSSGLEYSYKLKGGDSIWSIPAQSEVVSFAGLSPGKYVFMVRARKSSNDWSQPAVFSFTIKKPFWETWLFRVLVVLSVAAIIAGFYKFRLNQLRKVMMLRTKISRDLHDEIGSTLSGIVIISEMTKHQLGNEMNPEVKTSLDKIGVNSEEMLEKMSDIVWAINPQNDSFEKVISRLKTYAKNTTDQLGIHLHFNLGEGLEKYNLDMQKRSNIYLICKEAINNAIKYSECRNLSFALQQEDHHINISIVDDGKGFNALTDFDGNGLKNMKSRAQEIKADLNLNSEKGKGTSINLFLKIT